MLMGMCVTGLAQLTPSLTYVDDDVSASTLTTYTFSMSFGAADGDRYLIAALYGLSSTASRTVSSVAIGGVAASAMYYQAGAFNDATAWYGAYVPSGTSGNVSITWSGANARCSCGLYRAVGLKDPLTAYDTAFNTAGATGATLTIDVVPEAFVLGNAYSNVTPSFVWGGGFVEAWEIAGSPATAGYSGAIRGMAGSAATVNPTVSYSTTSTNRMATAITVR